MSEILKGESQLPLISMFGIYLLNKRDDRVFSVLHRGYKNSDVETENGGKKIPKEHRDAQEQEN